MKMMGFDVNRIVLYNSEGRSVEWIPALTCDPYFQCKEDAIAQTVGKNEKAFHDIGFILRMENSFEPKYDITGQFPIAMDVTKQDHYFALYGRMIGNSKGEVVKFRDLGFFKRCMARLGNWLFRKAIK